MKTISFKRIFRYVRRVFRLLMGCCPECGSLMQIDEPFGYQPRWTCPKCRYRKK